MILLKSDCKASKEMPIIYMNGVSYIFTTEGEIVLLATTKSNVNTAMMFNFLYSFIKICKNYFGEFSEAKIRENFVLIYELLDEVMDYGYPQLTDADLLKKLLQLRGVEDVDKFIHLKEDCIKSAKSFLNNSYAGISILININMVYFTLPLWIGIRTITMLLNITR